MKKRYKINPVSLFFWKFQAAHAALLPLTINVRNAPEHIQCKYTKKRHSKKAMSFFVEVLGESCCLKSPFIITSKTVPKHIHFKYKIT